MIPSNDDQRTTAGERPIESLIVLPLDDLTAEKDLGYLCEGIAEELTDALAEVEGLRLASRTSALQFQGEVPDVREIGERLGVGSVLEGSVRKSGTRLRISLRLVKTADGTQIWSERFDGDLDDVFELEEKIARSVAASLKPAHAREVAPLVRPRTREPEAHTLYLKGRHLWNRRTEEGLKKSLRYFQRAIEKDPGYARAHAGLASAFALLGIYGVWGPEETMARAKKAVSHALELDDGLSEAHACLGSIEAVYDWSWRRAQQRFERAIDLDPVDATAPQRYAIDYLVPMGRFDEAITQLERALELDPLSPAINATMGLQYYFAHDYERAVEEYLKILDLDASFAVLHLFLGEAYTELGEYSRAVEEIETAIRTSGGSPEMIAALAYAKARSGDEPRAWELLGKLGELARRRYVSPSLAAQIFAALGDQGPALAALEEACAKRATDLAWMQVRPTFQSLHSEPKWIDLLEKIGYRAPPSR